MEVLILLMRGVLAWLLLSAGAQKIMERSPSGEPGAQTSLTSRLPRPAVLGLGGVEVLTGAALFAPVIWPSAAFVAIALFGVFTAIVVIAAYRGQAGDCGCGGLLPAQRISYRHALFTGAAAIVAAGAGTAGIANAELRNLPSAGGVPLMMIELIWLPLMGLLLANALRFLWSARRTRQGIDRRVWGNAQEEAA